MMKECKYCGHIGVWKSGVVMGKQRYKCQNCRRTMCETDSREKFTDKERQAAITLYLEGCGFRRIAKILRQKYGKLFHNQTIIKWVKKAAISLPERKNHAPIDVLEMDELHTYIKKHEFGRR